MSFTFVILSRRRKISFITKADGSFLTMTNVRDVILAGSYVIVRQAH